MVVVLIFLTLLLAVVAGEIVIAVVVVAVVFFNQDFLSQTLTIHDDSMEKSGVHIYSLLPLPFTHKHLDIYLLLWTRHDYHVLKFTTLHVRWIPCIFNRMAVNYQTATQWYLLPWRIDIWLIDDGMLMSLYVMIYLETLYSKFNTEKWWNWILNKDPPSITSEPTNRIL